MFNRRSFLKYTGGTTLTLFTYDMLGVRQAIAAIPGRTLDPSSVPKWETPLLIPPVMPRAGLLFTRDGLVDYYEISVKEFEQQILPASKFGKTKVWGYGPAKALSPWAPMIHNAPSLTIEAKYHVPVRIKWINDLKDAQGNYLPHLLPVDPTLHWANPAGGDMNRDTRPTFSSTPQRYTGPVPMVTHVHGAVGVGDESDGYAEAWYLPAATNLPADHATEGTWYKFFAGKAWDGFRAKWGPGFATFQYPKGNRASTKWYHDHTLGMTRLNVYAGPAGFYNVRGGPAGDLQIRDSRNERNAVLPGPAPSALDQFLPGHTYREIPIAIQDRAFHPNGSLFYPDTRAFFDGIGASSDNPNPYLPNSDISPIWNPEFFGNTIMVNGNTWPHLNVEQRRYRFRFLNGCQARFLILDFNSIPGIEVWQIGNEGGLLAAPVNLTTANGNRQLMSPAERADVIVDFTRVPQGSHILRNLGPDEPFGGGVPKPEPGASIGDFDPADPATTGQLRQFRVGPSFTADLTTPPQFLQLPAITPLPEATVTRPLALVEEMSMNYKDAPAEAGLGIVDATTGVWTRKPWMHEVTENPAVGATEIWEFYNTTGDAHPMHVHETLFEVVNRQPILVDEASKTVKCDGQVRPPEPWENGWKDTVIAYPGEVTRIKAKFTTAGQYTWHCHIVEHEDNEMMRPYRIGREQPGQPKPKPHGGM